MIQIHRLTKTYGQVRAVDDASFSATPGRVTGFLGLNGSGKTTTLRVLLGLTRATSGAALINRRPYRALRHPLREVGAVVEQDACHPGQTGRAHLLTQAVFAGVKQSRVDALLDQVGLAEVAERRTREYSLGMRQRLAVATALLGQPSILVLDEPANGLDPEGILWLRRLVRDHARAGGTVLISSHFLTELEQLIDDVVVIARGQVRCAAPLAALTGGGLRWRVRGRDPGLLRKVFEDAGARVRSAGAILDVTGLPAEQLGDLAFFAHVPIYELAPSDPDLERIFFKLTASS